MHHQLADRLNAAVLDEVERLKTLPFSQLMSLPSLSERQVIVGEDMVDVIIWHDSLPSGEHQIVVQSNYQALLGMVTYLSADGFAVSDTGALRTLSDDELSSFR